MVNAGKFRCWAAFPAVILLAGLVLSGAAWLRGAEYDEQYTLFLTAGTARPEWPDTVFAAGTVVAMQSGHGTLAGIAHDLRVTDVHPPFYFWAVSLWRQAFGPSLFAARMLSVLCGIISLSLVAMIARRCGISPVMSVLLTLGCYGFAYTDAIARGFAPAHALTLCGVALLLWGRPTLAGVSFGAACCCNYLAVFVAAASIAMAGAWVAAVASVPFLALDGWFYIAQHGAREGQFPPFAIWPSFVRLAEYESASVFGGLPLYVDGVWRTVVSAVVGVVTIAFLVCCIVGRPSVADGRKRILLAAAAAPPIGLLLLGAVFNNTPIELRYLSFGLPFVALLAAWSMTRRRVFVFLMYCVLGIQFVSITGLLFSTVTMQPAHAAALQAVRLAAGAIVLVPRGNDGVGIVGAFGLEAPASMPILLVRPTDAIAHRIAPFRRVAVALLAQDRDSIAAITMLHGTLRLPDWRLVAAGSNLEVYERTGGPE